MTLMLHAGAEVIDFPALRNVPVPEATATHVPFPHHRLVELVSHTLAFYGHEVVEQNHGITPDGLRYFGLLSLRSTYGNYEDTVALRNSNDKSFPIGIGFGSRVFVCDNLAFIADHVIKRRHTVNAKRDLPGLVGELIEPLAIQREAQAVTFDRYQRTALTDRDADHVIMRLFREGVLNIQRVPDVLEQWDRPAHEEWGGRTAYRLFNATTLKQAAHREMRR